MISQIELKNQDALLGPTGKFVLLPKEYELVRSEDGAIVDVIHPTTRQRIILRWRSLDELAEKE